MTKNYLLILFFAILLSGCSKELEEFKYTGEESISVTEMENIPGDLGIEGVIKKIIYNGKSAVVKEVGDTYIFQGDIYLDKQRIDSINNLKGAAISRGTWSYLDNKIPYQVASNIENSQVQNAMDYIEAHTYINFVPKTSEQRYIEVINSYGDLSYSDGIGMPSSNNKRTIGLTHNASFGTVLHELLHALGVFHEHTRSDRDNFITVLWDNIPNDNQIRYQYEKYEQYNDGFDFPGGLDFNSVMLYPTLYYNNSPSMVRVSNGLPFSAQRSSLSNLDIDLLKFLYPKPRPRVRVQVLNIKYFSRSIGVDFGYNVENMDGPVEIVGWYGKSDHHTQYYVLAPGETTYLNLSENTNGSHNHSVKVVVKDANGLEHIGYGQFFTQSKHTVIAIGAPTPGGGLN